MGTPAMPMGGAPPGGPGGGGALQAIMGALQNKTANPGEDFSKQAANLAGADPSMILRQLESINKVLGVTFVKSFETLPNVANAISATMKALSRAIKEAQQAGNVSEVIGKSEEGVSGGQSSGPPPINFSPAMTGQNAGPPSPGIGT